MQFSHDGNRLQLDDGDGCDYIHIALWLREAWTNPQWRDPADRAQGRRWCPRLSGGHGAKVRRR